MSGETAAMGAPGIIAAVGCDCRGAKSPVAKHTRVKTGLRRLWNSGGMIDCLPTQCIQCSAGAWIARSGLESEHGERKRLSELEPTAGEGRGCHFPHDGANPVRVGMQENICENDPERPVAVLRVLIATVDGDVAAQIQIAVGRVRGGKGDQQRSVAKGKVIL